MLPYDRSITKEFTINNSDTWEYKTLNFAASPSSGTWDFTSNIGVRISICLAAGSASQTTADIWQTGNFYATSNQVNACDNIANNFRLCGAQLEVGSVATPFEQRLIQHEISLCQRYLEYYAITTMPSGAFYYPSYPWKVQKRATPTLSVAAGTLNGASLAVSGGDVSSDPRAGLSGFRQQSISSGASDVLIKGECEL
jgi:hypothetical protein